MQSILLYVYALILFLFYGLSITFMVFVLASQRSWAAFGCVLASVVASQGSAGLAKALNELRNHRNVKNDFIKRYPDCRYVAVALSDYFESVDFPKPGIAIFDALMPKLAVKIYDLSKNTRIYVVKKRARRVVKGKVPSRYTAGARPPYPGSMPRRVKVTVPSQLASYGTILDTSYIFVRDEPGDIEEAGRFFLLHELGHAGSFAGVALNSQFMYQMSIVNGLIFLSIFLNWNFTYLCMYVLQILVCAMLFREMSRRRPSLRFDAEIAADTFALHVMSEGVWAELRRELASLVLPDDGGLTQEQNLLRKAYFARNLELVSEGKKSEMILPGKPYAPVMIFPSVLIAAYLGSTLRPVGVYQLIIAWIYAAIIFGFGLRVLHLRERTKQEIDRIIAAKSKGQ